ncbi:hypothetical protein AB3F22_08585 [Actinomyces johnsonii]|uniref:hypothetical protein n=1 Tax=Actinomyces johnsonii TaxID=544581 RepID=UPI00042855BF|nr:hypothetical protein [Actinomyces johnsonii]
MGQQLKAKAGLGRSLPGSALTAAAAGAVLLIPLPFLGVLLSFIALVMGVAYLCSSSQYRRPAWAAVVIASVTLVATLVLAMTLLAARMESTVTTPQQSVPLQTAPSAPDDGRD